MTTRIMLTNTKRLGRHHHSTKNNNGNLTSPSYLNELVSLYEEKSRRRLLDWDKPLFGYRRSSFQKVLEHANKTTERASKFINKIRSKRLACADRAKLIPENATIRKEYIKCGKDMCEQRHGPYYYAYWKDPESKKLQKKYIGDHMPENKKSDDNSSNNNHKL